MERCVLDGLKIVIRLGRVESGSVTVNDSSFETVLSGFSTNTSWVALPEVSKNCGEMVSRLAGIVAVRVVLDPKVVAIGTPFHITRLPLTKFVPVAARVMSDLVPLGVVFGLMLVSVGAGRDVPFAPAMQQGEISAARPACA